MKKNGKKTVFDHSGSSIDSFLEEEGIREEVEAVAIKRVLAWQLSQEMQQQKKTTGYGARPSDQPVAIGSLAGPTECVRLVGYHGAGGEGAR